MVPTGKRRTLYESRQTKYVSMHIRREIMSNWSFTRKSLNNLLLIYKLSNSCTGNVECFIQNNFNFEKCIVHKIVLLDYMCCVFRDENRILITYSVDASIPIDESTLTENAST